AAVPNPRICLPPGRGCQLGLISSARLLFSPLASRLNWRAGRLLKASRNAGNELEWHWETFESSACCRPQQRGSPPLTLSPFLSYCAHSAHSAQPRWHLAAAPAGQSAPSAAARRLLLLLLLSTLPFLSQMSEDRITEMEKSRRTAQFSLGKTEAQTGKIPYASGGRSCVIRTELHQRQPPISPAPRRLEAGQQPGMQQQQLHLNQMPAHKADGAAADTGAAAKHRCRHARDAGYHAVDTDVRLPVQRQRRVQLHRVLNARDDRRTPSCSSSSPQQLHYRPSAGAGGLSRTAEPRPPPALPPRRRPPPRPHCPTATPVVTTSLSERAGPSGLCAATIGTVDPGPVSLDPTQRLIDALETLRDSINDSTSVALQQSRVRNRRRGTSAGQVNYKGGGLKNDERCRIRAERRLSSFQYLPWPRKQEAELRAVVVEIRVVFLKIGEIDTLKELYHADAFIQAKWKEPLLEGRGAEELKSIDLEKYWNPLLYIDNILSETKEATWVVAQHDPLNSDVYIVERRRIKGVFLETLELNDFPLDVQSPRAGATRKDLTIITIGSAADTEIELIPGRGRDERHQHPDL
uniref:Neur_chan_LBD domain-containing protein n=1 Tax=Macrostomum lignano TaxID=282301 RepID=A0A1I8JP22_9PLAT